MHPFLISHSMISDWHLGAMPDWRQLGLMDAIEQECSKPHPQAHWLRECELDRRPPWPPSPTQTDDRPEWSLPDLRLWTTLLKNGKADSLKRELADYLVDCPEALLRQPDFLVGLQQDLLQMVYSLLRTSNIPAHALFGDPGMISTFQQSIRSASDLAAWFGKMAVAASALVAGLPTGASLENKVRSFIHGHLNRDLTRDEIAAQVNLNPDYLSRLLKKATGLSVSEYVQRERLLFARDLLRKTALPVSSIALQCGYVSFSHFSRQFRKQMGQCPASYRRSS